MSKIDGELSRVIRNERKLEKIRHDVGYRGEPQVIGHIFSYAPGKGAIAYIKSELLEESETSDETP